MTAVHHWQDQVLAGPGGAMTDEVGVITGPLTLRTTAGSDGKVRFEIQYTDADEWYTLTGSPLPHGDPRALHTAALAAIRAGKGAEAPSAPA
ncbi:MULTISPECIES: hypothetical protein [unclassified Streptomyces]|uniref:hypothetical protein n=1 Tax=unclassified Streptomyces TaxID=2593676 RepID=UPI001BE88522|nr:MULTISPECIES: hypothetical protein [unclassified Streptomyces]MBT2404274.1 hypothetical protein [Streptomyces sp. ISL-21]MBT2454570.1 hypothetical protein [Streptomyces sp. ISL-86]MBT2612951.1 hypothetical protein [Streptomyces sp. ISL-87]